ncbi:MAG TPA: glycosyltransferase [Actinocrinis sp.]|nr:glycosyltransferase [Actinocrinis sp.]
MTELWVVVPAHNEERLLPGLLEALAAQRDLGFELVVVDNASTDATAEVVAKFAAGCELFPVHLVTEPVKGTGAAGDSGMRFAIEHGAALLMRTDADCLPDPGWIAAGRAALRGGLHLSTGPMLPRVDEFQLRWWEGSLLPRVVAGAAAFGRFRPSNRSPEYIGPYLMCPGCNIAITAAMYEQSGGFPRTSIDKEHEDRALVNRVRKHTKAIGYTSDQAVRASLRRVRAYGLRRTLAWYLNHGGELDVVDVR